MNGDLKQTFVNVLMEVQSKELLDGSLDSINFPSGQYKVVSSDDLDIKGTDVEGIFTVVPSEQLRFERYDLGEIVRCAVESSVANIVQRLYDDGWRISRKDGSGTMDNDRVEVYDIEWSDRK